MKKFRSPQEKKILSYKKDRRNDYGENSKASRKAIPFRKRWVNQTFRSTVKQKIFLFELSNELSAEKIDDDIKNIKRKYWKKLSDTQLGLFLRRKDKNKSSNLVRSVTKRWYCFEDYYVTYKHAVAD